MRKNRTNGKDGQQPGQNDEYDVWTDNGSEGNENGVKIINENFKQLKLENDMLRGENLEMRKRITELKVRTEELERKEEQ